MGYILKIRLEFKMGNRGGSGYKALCVSQVENITQIRNAIIDGLTWNTNHYIKAIPKIFKTKKEAQDMIERIEAKPHRKYLYKIERV